jgi:hypothetical protein
MGACWTVSLSGLRTKPESGTSPGPVPCDVLSLGQGGRLSVDDVALAELVAELEGRAVWLVSDQALTHVIDAATEALTVDIGALGPPAVLARLASAGWWARCHSSHELSLAGRQGFPPERTVVARGVRDDVLIKDALGHEVAVLEVCDETDARNVARVAGFLEREVPPDTGAPDGVPGTAFAGCAGLLAPLLRGPPDCQLDAPPMGTAAPGVTSSGAADEYDLWALEWSVESPAATACQLTTLSRSGDAGRPVPSARLHAAAVRGDWVFVPVPGALGLHAPDPVWPDPAWIMTRQGSWRFLDERPLPPRPEAGA